MGIFGAVVHSLVSSMRGVGQQFSARRTVAGEPVRHHHARRIPQTSQSLLKKLSSSLLVSTWLHKDIESAAILINRTPQILQATADAEVHLVEMPRIAQLSTSSTNAFGVVLTELVAPGSDRLIRHHHAALGHQLLDIPIADRESEIQPNAVADDLRRK